MKKIFIAILLISTTLNFAQKAKPKTTTGPLATFENLKAEIITEYGKQKLAIIMDNAGKKENIILKEIITKDKAQQQIDEILDKISQSGYDSLTKEEKEFLFKAGK